MPQRQTGIGEQHADSMRLKYAALTASLRLIGTRLGVTRHKEHLRPPGHPALASLCAELGRTK